jgi:hypothetical protein
MKSTRTLKRKESKVNKAVLPKKKRIQPTTDDTDDAVSLASTTDSDAVGGKTTIEDTDVKLGRYFIVRTSVVANY